jgi:hypothetical protein
MTRHTVMIGQRFVRNHAQFTFEMLSLEDKGRQAELDL